MTAPVRPNAVDDLLGGSQGNPVDALLGGTAPVSPAEQLAKLHADFKSGALQRRNAILNANDQGAAKEGMAQDEATTRGKVLGTMAAGMGAVPGGEAVQSTLSSLLNREPYAQARGDIKGAEASAPAAARIPAQIAGGVASTALLGPAAKAAAAIPRLGSLIAPALATGAGQGAMLGAADQALNSDPTSGVGSRFVRGAVGAGVGGLAGGLTDAAVTGVRALAGKSLGANALARTNAMNTADKAAYGTADQEAARFAANNPQSAMTALHMELESPTIRPYTAMIRNSETMAGKSDAEIAPEVFKLMSETQGKKLALGDRGIYSPAAEIQLQDIGAAKQRLQNAFEPIAPSFRGAVKGHATLASQRDAFNQGADVTARVLKDAEGTAGKLDIKSPESFVQDVSTMRPDEAQAASEGVLGRVRSNMGLKVEPSITSLGGLLKGFGLGPSLINAAKATPLVRATDAQAGNQLPSAVQRSLLALLQSQAGR